MFWQSLEGTRAEVWIANQDTLTLKDWLTDWLTGSSGILKEGIRFQVFDSIYYSSAARPSLCYTVVYNAYSIAASV